MALGKIKIEKGQVGKKNEFASEEQNRMVLEKIKIEKGQVGKQIKKEDLKEESKETWANKLFNKEEDSYRKKIKLEVQGSKTVEN